MATKKSTPVKKTTKKPVRKAASKTSAREVSFRPSRDDSQFMTLKLTRQTLYWLVIGVMAVVFTLWILKLQSDINNIYDNIDQTNAANNVNPIVKKKVH